MQHLETSRRALWAGILSLCMALVVLTMVSNNVVSHSPAFPPCKAPPRLFLWTLVLDRPRRGVGRSAAGLKGTACGSSVMEGPSLSKGCTPPGPPCRAVALESLEGGVGDGTTGEGGGEMEGGGGRGKRGFCRLCACQPRGITPLDLVMCPDLLVHAGNAPSLPAALFPSLERLLSLMMRGATNSYKGESLPCSPPIPEIITLGVEFRRDESSSRSEGLPCSSVRTRDHGSDCCNCWMCVGSARRAETEERERQGRERERWSPLQHTCICHLPF